MAFQSDFVSELSLFMRIWINAIRNPALMCLKISRENEDIGEFAGVYL